MNLETANRTQEETLLRDLQSLLEKQIEGVKKSDFRSVETLSEQADILIAELVKKRLPEQPEWRGRMEQFIHLYKQLELMIAAEKESVCRQLRKLGKGKKTIQAYHSKKKLGAS